MNRKYLFLCILIFATALILGIGVQKYLGVGNLIKWINPRHGQARSDQELRTEHEGKLSIFILAGQSNMEGGGDLEDYSPLDTKGRAYVFTEDYNWVIAEEPVRDKVGPSVAFASTLINHNPDKIIGLINCARGGTNIEQWSKSHSEGSLYLQMIKRALAASSQGKIAGVLFFQGENDAEGKTNDHYNDWDIQFKEFVKNTRRDLGNDDLPIIFAQIGKGDDTKWKSVKERQALVQIENVVMIKTDDINDTNSIHFTSPGYVKLGQRFGEAWITHFERD